MAEHEPQARGAQKAVAFVAVPAVVGGAVARGPELYALTEPARFLRVFGQPILGATCWDCQRLRCSTCGDVHTARAPAEAQGPKFDETAVAMLALSRYSVGLPHHRLEQLQRNMKLPVPSSTQWEVLHPTTGSRGPTARR